MKCIVSNFNGSRVFNDLKSVSLPVSTGEIQILPGHAECFCVLVPGKIKISGLKLKDEVVEIEKGSVYVKSDEVLVVL